MNVTALDEKHLQYSFTHPGLLYPTGQTQRKRKRHDSQRLLDSFTFHVDIVNVSRSDLDVMRMQICELKCFVDRRLTLWSVTAQRACARARSRSATA